ncbi:MAG: mannosyltransferase [Flaviramulus sp.]|nr:glycosyltransferase 87 family protein [Flaviramulus sp.]NNC50985.1 mannosyltransferase [Flaviramulus sp.]
MLLNSALFKIYKAPILLIIASIICYAIFAYDLIRTDYLKLVSLYFALFILFFKLVQIFKHNIKGLTYISFGIRAIFILSIPNLSQDFYRFIWDGRMIIEGINPFLFTPYSFIEQNEFPIAQAQELFIGMGELNASHFSNYPPLNQLCFLIAALFSSKSILGSVVVIRLLIIAADFGTLHFGFKLLDKLSLPAHHIFWYILNPFIIIELTGNLHFEGLMIFFLVWGLYLLHINKWKYSAVVFALSVSVKLIPLMFLPLLFQKLGWKKSIGFYTITGLVNLLLFLPFYSTEFVQNYTNTVALWFQNFEFNASLYYIAREVGYTFRGRNEIAIIGSYIPKLVIIFVLILTFLRKNKTTKQLITAMLLVLTFYYFTATTIHPWYVATLLLLSVFTKYKFPLVWSFVIILSYLAYLNVNKADKAENLWIIALEYAIVYGVFFWEVLIKKAPKLEA